MGRDKIKLILKTLLGVLLFYYVLRSKMIDFELLQSVLFHPFNLIIALVFLLFSAVCCTIRWHLLVEAQGLSLSLRNLFSLTMIGSFFNTFMPGSVGGDLIKAWYVAGREPQRRTRAVFTVLLDRLIGLSVIIFYSAFTLVFYQEWLAGKPQLQLLALSLWAFTSLSFLFGFVFFLPHLWRAAFFQRALQSARRVQSIAKLLDAALLYQSARRNIFKAILLSVLGILGLILLYYIQGTTLGVPLSLPQYFFIVPVALTVSAIPLLPGGIGTGQVAFFTLFQWIGAPDPNQGSTLCTLVQVYTILFNCFGAVFYLKFKRQPKDLSIETASPSFT